MAGISILVCGRTGVGKSSLINYILGEDVCKVGDPAHYINDTKKAFSPETAAVEGFDGNMNGVTVTVYDSPGLQDGTQNDQEYVDKMYEKCRDVDLVLYCHDITETRWTDPEMKSLRLLTEKFGDTFWNKAILAFTKANLLRPAKSGVDEKKYLEDVAKVTEDRFWAELKKVLLTKRQGQLTTSDDQLATNDDQLDSARGLVKRPPAVLAGSEREQILPTGPFIGKLWIGCLKLLRLDKANSFIKATNSVSRIVLQSDGKRAKDNGCHAGLLEFKPTMEDLTEAWKVMLERRKKLKLATNDDKELQYLIFLDKEMQKQLVKLRDGVETQSKESEGIILMISDKLET